jgi:hypothetical protein
MSKNLMAIGSLGNVLFAAMILGGMAHAGTICESANRREACGENGAGHKLSPSEVKSLLKSASMPEDHWQLAERHTSGKRLPRRTRLPPGTKAQCRALIPRAIAAIWQTMPEKLLSTT